MLVRAILSFLLSVFFGLQLAAAEPVKVGFSIAKTGLFAAAADSQLKTYEFWKEEVNAKGGIDVKGTKRPVAFVYYDDQSNPGKAVEIYTKLITDEKVDLLLAPFGTPTHVAIVGVTERYQFPVIGNTAVSMKLRTINPGNMWFVTGVMPDRLGQSVVELLAKRQFRSVALLANQLPLSLETKSALLPALQKAGIEIKVNEEYPPSITDMTSMLSAVKAAKPDAVLVLSYPADSATYLRQAREIGIAAPFQFLQVGPTETSFAKQFGSATNGIVTMGHWSPKRPEWSKAQPFFDAYQKKYGEPPDFLDSALTYVSCEVLEQAVKKAGLDRAALRAEIAGDTFDTINGKINFTGVENRSTPAGLLQIQGDHMELIWPETIKTADFVAKPAW